MKGVVSVILPIYNHGKFLKDRIESILNQTYENFELIILDDASSDNSLSVVDSYKDPRIKIILKNKKNIGLVFSQWMNGVSYAEGEYIWIAESDDYSDLSFLESMVFRLNLDESRFAFCRSVVVQEDSGPQDDCRYKEINGFGEKPVKYLGSDFLKAHMLESNSIPNVSSVLFRSEAFLDLSRQVLSMRYAGDWLFYCILMQAGYVSYEPSVTNYFRMHDSTTRKTGLYANSGAYMERLLIYKWLRENGVVDSSKYMELVDFNIRCHSIEKNTVYQIIKSGNEKKEDVVIYGAGEIGRSLALEIFKRGGEVSFFIDREACGNSLLDRSVYSFEEAHRLLVDKKIIIASARFYEEIHDHLLFHGLGSQVVNSGGEG